MYAWQKFHPILPEFRAPFYWEAFDVNWCPLEMRHGGENESVILHSNFRLLIPWIARKCIPWLLKAHKLFLSTSSQHCSKEQPVCSWCGHLLFFQPINIGKKMMFVLSITSCICLWPALCRTPWLKPCKISASLSGFVLLQMFWRNKQKPWQKTQCGFDTARLVRCMKNLFFPS